MIAAKHRHKVSNFTFITKFFGHRYNVVYTAALNGASHMRAGRTAFIIALDTRSFLCTAISAYKTGSFFWQSAFNHSIIHIREPDLRHPIDADHMGPFLNLILGYFFYCAIDIWA